MSAGKSGIHRVGGELSAMPRPCGVTCHVAQLRRGSRDNPRHRLRGQKAEPAMTIEAVTRQREELGTQLARLRRTRGHTQTSLSRKLGYARVTITMAEQGHPAGRAFWQCCDQELATGGQLVAAYDQIDDLRRRITRPRTFPEQATQEYGKNVTEADDAQTGSITSLISWLSSSTASDETINDLARAAFTLTVAHPQDASAHHPRRCSQRSSGIGYTPASGQAAP